MTNVVKSLKLNTDLHAGISCGGWYEVVWGGIGWYWVVWSGMEWNGVVLGGMGWYAVVLWYGVVGGMGGGMVL